MNVKLWIILLLSLAFCVSGCTEIMLTPTAQLDLSNEGETEMTITEEQALAIAHEDASNAYRDLSMYRVNIVMEDGNWRIDYELINQQARGGGPHYVVSGSTGEILLKTYEQ